MKKLLKKAWNWITIYRATLIALWAIFFHTLRAYDDPTVAWVGLLVVTYIEGRFGAVLDIVVQAVRKDKARRDWEERQRIIDALTKRN